MLPRDLPIGAAIKGARAERNLTQEALAHAAHIDPSYLGDIERGAGNPTVAVITRIAEALGVPLSELVERAEKRL